MVRKKIKNMESIFFFKLLCTVETVITGLFFIGMLIHSKASEDMQQAIDDKNDYIYNLERKEKQREEKDCPRGEVKCEECKHKIEKQDAFRVVITDSYRGGTRGEWWFCQMHKPPYEKMEVTASITGIHDFKKYYAMMEVDVKGTPVGYKFIKIK